MQLQGSSRRDRQPGKRQPWWHLTLICCSCPSNFSLPPELIETSVSSPLRFRWSILFPISFLFCFRLLSTKRPNVYIEEPVLNQRWRSRWRKHRNRKRDHPCVSLPLNEPRACTPLCHTDINFLSPPVSLSSGPFGFCEETIVNQNQLGRGPLLKWKEEGGWLSLSLAHGTRLIIYYAYRI